MVSVINKCWRIYVACFIKIMFSGKFLLLDHIASRVLVFNLFLARLFSFIIVIFNSFVHACVFATKQAPR